MTNHTDQAHDYDSLAAQLDVDLDDPSVWVEDSAPRGVSSRLGAVITLRLSPDVADEVRALASSAGIAYTAMLREWIEERVAEMRDSMPTVVLLGAVQSTQPAGPDPSNLMWSHSDDQRASAFD